MGKLKFKSFCTSACPIRHELGHVLTIVLLATGSLLGNLLPVEISFGTHFIFGSVASITAAVWFGWPLATLIAGFGAIPTWSLWHHPGYIVLAMAEALFVALTFRRFWHNVIIATTVYWFLPGALLFAIIYGVGLHVEPRGLVFLWSKQCINSILNALIASGVLVAAALLRDRRQRIPLQQAFFNTLIAVTFVPMLAMLAISSRDRMEDIQKKMEENTRDQAQTIVHYLSLWRKRNIDAVSALAFVAQSKGLKPSASLAQDLEIIHKAHPSFYDVFVADHTATTFGFHPSKGPQGERLIGLHFADRKYFRDVATSKTPLVSDVILGRGGIDFPIICFVAPILSSDSIFKGFALGSYDVRKLADDIRLVVTDPTYKVTLTDSQGTIITSTDPLIQPLHDDREYFEKNTVPHSNQTYVRHRSKSSDLAAYKSWQESSYGMISEIPGMGWTVRVEASLSTFTTEIEKTYLENFAQILSLTLGGMALSVLIMRWVSQPISQLASFTGDIFRNPEMSEHKPWPKSRFAEIAILIENFSSMSQSLRQRFDDLNKEIIERKSTEERLQVAMQAAHEANVAKSIFLTNMSHEIRTPLAAIVGYAEYLAAMEGASSEASSSIDAILRNSSQLAQLVNDILDLSRIEAGHIKIQKEWVTVNDIVASGVEALKGRADDKGLELRVIGDGPFPARLHIDPTRLSQILINIVGNAIKFTEKGHVTVTFSLGRSRDNLTQGDLKILVVDSGIGISAATRDKLFQPFVQGDATYSRRFGGTGLGLALARNIAVCLGGNVTLLDSHTKQGSSFLITVQVGFEPQALWHPDLQAARAATRAPHAQQKTSQELAGKKILLVEDSPDNRLLISRMLARYGALVTSAVSGNEGVQMAEQGPWDVILMDMQMPITDGYQATQTLRKRGYRRPIIALTAHAMAEEKEKCLAAGCDDHVTKPVPWAHLVATILKWSANTPSPPSETAPGLLH